MNFPTSPTTENASVGTRSYMMVPADFKTDITNKAVVPANQTNNVRMSTSTDIKESDYVRFIYDVDKNKMDALLLRQIVLPLVSRPRIFPTARLKRRKRNIV